MEYELLLVARMELEEEINDIHFVTLALLANEPIN